MTDTMLRQSPPRDQYADGKAAQVWEVFIGDRDSRTHQYKTFLVDMLKKNNCRNILDVACGTGIDSVMLVEEGFNVTSIDASDKMLKHAYNKRWDRRKEKGFDGWVIQEANWLTLAGDLRTHLQKQGGFDAVICLGNSFAHLLDDTIEKTDIKCALKNFEKCVRPGGLLIIDHRNFDYILDTGRTPSKCLYYNSKNSVNIETSTLFRAGQPSMVIMDYFIELTDEDKLNDNRMCEFRLTYYPHRLMEFSAMLENIFPENSKHEIFADFKPIEEEEEPGFYIHVMKK